MLDEKTIQFREALQQQVEQPDARLDILHGPLTALAQAAKVSDVPSERFVVMVKREWDSLVERGLVPKSVAHDELRGTVVTAAIKAYYMQ